MKLKVTLSNIVFRAGFLFTGIFLFSKEIHALPPRSYKLQNQYMVANFNQKGMANFYNKGLNKDYRFDKDDFSVTIDSQLIAKKDLNLVSVNQENNRLIYNWANNNYDIRVIYELKPSWEFISKHLEISPKSAKSFWVNQVEVLDQKLVKTITSDYVPHGWWPGYSTKNYGAFLRFDDGTGLLALVQNPFLDYKREGGSFSLTYNPDMSWDKEYGIFSSDRACIGAYKMTGRKIPVNMLTEWKWTQGIIPEGGETQDEAEVTAFTNCVQQFILDHTPRPINVHVAWCENDFQEDVSMASGREVYKRIIDQAAARR